MQIKTPGRAVSRCNQLSRTAGIVVAALLGSWHVCDAQWQPDKNVEIIVNTSPGGGLDQFGRQVQRIIQEQRLFPVTSSVANKPGGGGMLGFTYLNQHAGDGHYVIVTTPTFMTNHIMGKSNISLQDVTPIAEMFSEYVVIMVRAESPLKSGEDLLKAMKSDPTRLSIGIATSLGNHNHAGIALPLRAAGVDIRKLKTVIFQSVADANTALLGGHIDLVPTPPGNVVPLAASGKLRGIAISAPARLPGAFANVPTWKEQGVNVVLSVTRNVVGPRGLAADRIAFWEGAMERVVRTTEWTKELEAKLLSNTFAKSVESGKRLQMQLEDLTRMLTELGLAKPN